MMQTESPSHTQIYLTGSYGWHTFIKVHESLEFGHFYEGFETCYVLL